MNDFDKYKKIRLVPVEVFGADDGYGLMDAVEAWSDCNRAYGKIYRVDDIEGRTGETVEVLVKKSDLPFFEKRFDSEKPHPTNFLPLSTLKQVIEGMSWKDSTELTSTRYEYFSPFGRGYNAAKSDLLTTITKLQEGK